MIDAAVEPDRRRLLFWLAFLTVETLVLVALGYAGAQQFRWHAFFDPGIDPVVYDLVRRGYRPGIDLGFVYGLVVAMVGQGLYGAFGWSPLVEYGAGVAFNLIFVWGLARFAAAVRLGPAGLGVVALTLPYYVSGGFPSLVHIVEPAFLAHALADHAQGRRSRALAITTASLFVKPSMSYVYGFLQVVLLVREHWRDGWAGLVRPFVPAAVVGLTLAATLGAYFGYDSLLATLFPIHGSRIYRENNFGFFYGTGRLFWRPPGVRPGFYAGTVVGFWLAGAVTLDLAAAWIAARQAARREWPGRAAEVAVCCAILHTVFVCVFFGAAFSWFYYFFLMVCGLAAFSTQGRVPAVIVGLLCLPALTGHNTTLARWKSEWRGSRPSVATAGLWATPEEREEWEQVQARTAGMRRVLLAHNDNAALIFPGFEPPQVVFVTRGFHRPQEIARKNEQIRKAEAVVVVTIPLTDETLDRWPEFAESLKGMLILWEGKSFRVYLREGS